jgi:hypothetical protein
VMDIRKDELKQEIRICWMVHIYIFSCGLFKRLSVA